jgi:NAD(P)-dependent dehydrogenase (short-subunit alcohol dehydrogenase family)
MSTFRFENRVALVTGGASGIGLCSALRFAAGGAAVAICDLDQAAGEAALAVLRTHGVEGLFVQADLSQAHTVKGVADAVLQRFGRIDILVNNVGAGRPGDTIIDQDEADWDWTHNICLKSAWLFMKYALPGMVTRHHGAVVNIASLAGIRVAPNSSPAYAAAKAGVVHLTRFAAVQYAPHGIRVNVVSPGLTETPSVIGALSEEERVAIVSKLHAVPRLAVPEETAAAIAWLCSDEAPIVTGINIPVDGGWSAR